MIHNPASWKLPEREAGTAKRAERRQERKKRRMQGAVCCYFVVHLFGFFFSGDNHSSVQFTLCCSVALQFLLQWIKAWGRCWSWSWSWTWYFSDSVELDPNRIRMSALKHDSFSLLWCCYFYCFLNSFETTHINYNSKAEMELGRNII